jgi:hypothetical protein
MNRKDKRQKDKAAIGCLIFFVEYDLFQYACKPSVRINVFILSPSQMHVIADT